MSAPIVIEIAGSPVAKARPKARAVKTKDGREFTQIYTPAKTRQWEAWARQAAQDAMAGRVPLECPVAVQVVAYLMPSASWPAWKREAALRGEIAPTAKPDEDNIGKAGKDALKSVVYRDDSLIVESTVIKRYDARPRVVITVTPLTAAPCQISRKGDLSLIRGWMKAEGERSKPRQEPLFDLAP